MRSLVLAALGLLLLGCGPSGGSAAVQDSAASETPVQLERATVECVREHDKQVSASLTALTRANEAMQETLAANQTQIAQLQEARRKLTEAVRAAASPTEERTPCLPPLAPGDVEKEKRELLRRVEEFQRRLDAESSRPGSVGPRGGGDVPTQAPPPDAGQVLAVDQGSNVVIVSLGAEDELKPGFRYVVSRGDEYVGTIEIRTVEAKKSSARSLRDLQKSPIEVGDKVIPK